ncbi:hypothetical protein KBC54_01230 [Patescibacteria group bacterium]|nr:hypothetical protein [Patescibacteria group bacterium]
MNINLISIFFSIISVYFLLVLVKKSKSIIIGYVEITLGVFIAITLHAFVEYFGAIGVVSGEWLYFIMPILISIGSIMIYVGSRDLYKNLFLPLEEVTALSKKLEAKNDELVKEIQSREASDRKLSFSEEQLKQKIEELEKINHLMVGRELKMFELKEEIKKLKAGS